MVDYLPCSRFKVCRILCLSIALSGFFLSFSCCLVGDNDAIFLPFRWIRLNPFKRNWDGNVVVFLLSLSSLSLFFLIFLFFYPWSNVSLMFIDLLAAASALEMLCNLWVFRGSSFLVLISEMNAHLGGVGFFFLSKWWYNYFCSIRRPRNGCECHVNMSMHVDVTWFFSRKVFLNFYSIKFLPSGRTSNDMA